MPSLHCFCTIPRLDSSLKPPCVFFSSYRLLRPCVTDGRGGCDIDFASQLASAKRAMEASTAHAAELQRGIAQVGRELRALRESEATLAAELLDTRGRLGALQTEHAQAVQERVSVLASLELSQSQCVKLEARLAAVVVPTTPLGVPDSQSEVRGIMGTLSVRPKRKGLCSCGAIVFIWNITRHGFTQAESSPERRAALAAAEMPEAGALHARAAQLERLLTDVVERAEAVAADRVQLQQQAAESREELRAMRQRLDSQSAELTTLQSQQTNQRAPQQALPPPQPPSSPPVAVTHTPPSPATPASTSADGAPNVESKTSERDTLTDQDTVVLYQGGHPRNGKLVLKTK